MDHLLRVPGRRRRSWPRRRPSSAPRTRSSSSPTCSARTAPTTASGSGRSRTWPARWACPTRSSSTSKVCVDKRRQWKYAGNVRHSAGGQHGRRHGHRSRPVGPPPAADGLRASGRTGDAMTRLDAIVVGGGPNGLAAAIELARAGRSVRIYEAADEVGGGTRSAELTLPGFVHDPCASVHPLSLASPFFRSLDLARHGLEWVQPEAPLAHALEPGRSVVLERDLGGDRRRAGPRRRRLAPPVRAARARVGAPRPDAAGAGHPPAAPPAAPGAVRRAGPAAGARPRAHPVPRAGGAGAVRRHGRPLDAAAGGAADVLVRRSSSGLLAHAVGWPLARGGSGSIARALEAEARSLGVEIVTGHRVDSLADVPAARAYLLDVTPRQALAISGDRLGGRYRRQLEAFRYGPGVFKVDWALDGPDPVDGPGHRAGRDGAPRRAAWARSSPPRRPSGAGASRPGRSCSSSSRRSPTRRARPRASTSRGRTATCPTARPPT